MSDTAPRRRWFQFSLWAMFVAVTLAAIPVAFVAWVNHALTARAQRRAAPLTNERLDLIIRGTLSNAAIQPIKRRFVEIGPNTTKIIGAVSIIDDNELDNLIRALTPIEVVSAGILPTGTADYQLFFRAAWIPRSSM